MTDKEICQLCSADCCRWVKIQSEQNHDDGWCNARGIKKEFLENGLLEYTIPSVCPHLDTWTWGCKIHLNKPKPCSAWKCNKLLGRNENGNG